MSAMAEEESSEDRNATWSNLLRQSVQLFRTSIKNAKDRCISALWSSAAQERTQLPQLPLITSFRVCENLTASYEFFRIDGSDLVPIPEQLAKIAEDEYCCGSGFGWLVLMNPIPQLLLLNPLTNDQIDLPKPYPHSLPSKDVPLNLHSLITFCKGTKIVLSEDPLTNPNFVIVQIGRDLVFCKRGDSHWTRVEHPGAKFYKDAIVFKRNIVFITKDSILVYDIERKMILRRIFLAKDVMRSFLTDLNGDLFLVDLSSIHGTELEVAFVFQAQKVSIEQKKLIRVDNLGDYSFFVGKNMAVSLKASEVTGCKANCVYYAEYNQIPPVMLRICFTAAENDRIYGSNGSLSRGVLVSPVWLKPTSLSAAPLCGNSGNCVNDVALGALERRARVIQVAPVQAVEPPAHLDKVKKVDYNMLAVFVGLFGLVGASGGGFTVSLSNLKTRQGIVAMASCFLYFVGLMLCMAVVFVKRPSRVFVLRIIIGIIEGMALTLTFAYIAVNAVYEKKHKKN